MLHAPPLVAAGGALVAVATSDPLRAAEAVHRYPGVTVVPDLDALLATPALDLVVVCTPTGLHHRHAIDVLDAGLPVVVDKPLGVTAEQAREVVAHAVAAGVPLTVFHNRRWEPSHLTATALVDRGELGRTWRVDYRWERWRPEVRERWREQAPAAAGGGVLLDLAPHMVDLAVSLLGPVASVYAEVESRLRPADDDVRLALRHVAGGISHLTASSTTAAPGPRLRVLGSRAAYLFDDFREASDDVHLFPEWSDTEGTCGWIVRGHERARVATAPGSVVDFYRTVFGALGSPDAQAAMPVDPTDAVVVAEVVDAARRSAQDQQVVRLG